MKNALPDNPEPQSICDDPACNVVNSQYEVINCYPHDRAALTEGLKFYKGFLYESTGGDESDPPPSSLRRVEIKTGKVIENIPVNEEYFAEGLTIFDGKIFQLTLRSYIALIYNLKTVRKPPSRSRYKGFNIGWGLTNDSQHLIVSDGTDKLYFVDPKHLKVVGNPIGVHLDGNPLELLNELEYIKDSIYANIRFSNFIARINPVDGKVHNLIDFGAIRPPETASCIDCGPNGIAFDEESGHLFITGKKWPTLFEICLLEGAG